MEDLVLSIPTQDAAFIETLASRMGWTMRRRPDTPQLSDEEIQAEINAYRKGV